MRSLAEIHAQWESMAVKQQAIPAVHRRLILFREAIPGLNNMPPDLAAARDACIQLQNTVWDRLRVWADLQWPCHPCFCDLHADHVLFSGETVTGMVDFGAMKIDHPAIDLARLLGDYSDSIHNVWGLALEEYHRCRPGLEIPLGLVKTLALSTAVGGLKHWLHRATAGDQRVFHESVGFRLQRLRLRAFRLIE
jgi:homoserine kinase type II